MIRPVLVLFFLLGGLFIHAQSAKSATEAHTDDQLSKRENPQPALLKQASSSGDIRTGSAVTKIYASHKDSLVYYLLPPNTLISTTAFDSLVKKTMAITPKSTK